MKKQIKFTKRNIKPLIFIFIIVIVLGVGGTMAYLTHTFKHTNTFKTSTYDVQIEEEFYNKWGTKKVSIVNNESANTPVIIRLTYNELWSNGDKVLSNKINGEDTVTKNWTETFKNDFVLGSDGWYYYKKILPGSGTVRILDSIEENTNVLNSPALIEDYNSHDYELSFNYEAIQANKDAVKELWGYNITLNGSDITWPF